MYDNPDRQPLPMGTTCDSLLSELQKIWDEIGEPDIERDKMLLELEQQCLDAYRRKVDHASRSRAQLRQAVADSEAELAHTCAVLGERPAYNRQHIGSLKDELQAIRPQLEEMQKRKTERKSQFAEVHNQLHIISKELFGVSDDGSSVIAIDESDLSLKRLEDLENQLHELQTVKSDRVKQVLDHLNTLNLLCAVLGIDFKLTIREIHPSLDDSCGTKGVSADIIERLFAASRRLEELKRQQMQRLQDLGTAMVELWTLLDTPLEEQEMFHKITRNIAASEDEITDANTLSMDFLKWAEAEVSRLQEIKSSKIKEVLLKKRFDLEEICRRSHLVVDSHDSVNFPVEAIESGAINPSLLLEKIELQISKAKGEALSRKEILEKVEKWFTACEEESWLEEYNRDDNRYNAGRGTHLLLKRAEKARALLNKIPAMVEILTSKVKAWEKERGVEFLYDGVSLLSMLEQYCIMKQGKEKERQRQKDQKKIQGQLMTQQEALFGSKPSPSKSGKKPVRVSSIGASSKRFSIGGAMLQTPYIEKAAHSSSLLKKKNSVKQQTPLPHQNGAFMAAPGKYVSGVPGKQHSGNSSNLREKESKVMRKPLSPLSPLLSSHSNSAANIQDQNRKNGEFQETLCGNRTPTATPMKNISAFEGNATPKTILIPMLTTPSTVSVAMQTATTPATPGIPHVVQDIEYSFEERRAGFQTKSCPRPLPII